MSHFTLAKTAARKLIKLPVTVVVSMAAVIAATVPHLDELLQYDRARIFGGELWRLATCHVTHWNAEHLRWDLFMFLVLGAICELRSPRRMSLCLAAGAAAVSATVALLFPDVSQYRGLSGIDTALFTMLALELFCEARRERNNILAAATVGMLMGFIAKTGYEALTGATIFVDEQSAGFVPLVWDHLAGATVGAWIALSNSPCRIESAMSFDHTAISD